jgi:hypothetical protein
MWRNGVTGLAADGRFCDDCASRACGYLLENGDELMAAGLDRKLRWFREWNELNSVPDSLVDSAWENRVLELAYLRGNKYVCPFNWAIPTRFGDVHVPFAMLSDGSTAVPDRCPKAYWAHDRLFLAPSVMTGIGVRRELTRNQVDCVYADVLRMHKLYFEALWSRAGLWMVSWALWNENVKLRAQIGEGELLRYHTLPKPGIWAISSFDLSRASVDYSRLSEGV